MLLLFDACAPMAEIDLQVINPAEITFPLNVKEIAFLNRSVYPAKLYTDTGKWDVTELYVIDTVVNNWMFKGVRESMSQSPLFEFNEIHVMRKRRFDSAAFLKPMSIEELDRLKKLESIGRANALVSLDYFHLGDSVHVEFNLAEFAHEAYLGFYITALWRIYDLERDTLIDEVTLKDTSQWYAYHEYYNFSLRGLPSGLQALRQSAYNAGYKYGVRISPTWYETTRYYYPGGSREMKTASKLVAQWDWQGASAIWKRLADGEEKKLAARACFNLALASEVDDRIIQAIDWAIRAYAIRQDDLTREYIDILEQRYEDNKDLRKQLPAG
jgi:hypothetical protein